MYWGPSTLTTRTTITGRAFDSFAILYLSIFDYVCYQPKKTVRFQLCLSLTFVLCCNKFFPSLIQSAFCPASGVRACASTISTSKASGLTLTLAKHAQPFSFACLEGIVGFVMVQAARLREAAARRLPSASAPLCALKAGSSAIKKKKKKG